LSYTPIFGRYISAIDPDCQAFFAKDNKQKARPACAKRALNTGEQGGIEPQSAATDPVLATGFLTR